MFTLPGRLTITTIHGRNGPFKVGRLATSLAVLSVKDAELDPYDEGQYDGDFLIVEIRPCSYYANGRTVTEIRATLGGMTLSKADAPSGEEDADPVGDLTAPSAALAHPVTVSGQLFIKTIHGRFGPFNVGRLVIPGAEFVVKSVELDQYDEGRYDGDFVLVGIRPYSYYAYGRTVIEVRATLGGMTLSNTDALSGEEAQALTPQEVDPVEETQTVAPARPEASVPAPPRDPGDPGVDAAPFGCEPAPPSPDMEDETLFGTLWPLGETVVLDATLDRLIIRQQRARLKVLGYAIDMHTQVWHLSPPPPESSESSVAA